MAKTKVKIVRQKVREIKKPDVKELEEEQEEVVEEGGEKEEEKEQKKEREEGEIEKEDFEFFPAEEEFGVERKAPLLELSKPSKPREELETMLQGVAGETKREGEKEKESKKEFKYDISELYSESSVDKELDRERDVTQLISELRRRDVLVPTPKILPESEEEDVEMVKPAELANVEFQEYIMKYAGRHEEGEDTPEILHKEDKDIKKYKSSAKFKGKVY